MPSRFTSRRMATPRIVCVMVSLLAGSACASPVQQPTTSDPDIAFLNSGRLPATVPFSEAVRIGPVVQLSGQLGAKPGELTVVPGGLDAESRQMLDNIRNTLVAHGLTMDDVVKCTIMLADMSEWAAFNAIYATYFSPPYPARSAMGVNGLALGARVEAECMAVDGAARAKRRGSAEAR